MKSEIQQIYAGFLTEKFLYKTNTIAYVANALARLVGLIYLLVPFETSLQ